MTIFRIILLIIAIVCFLDGGTIPGFTTQPTAAFVCYETGDTMKMPMGQKQILQSNELKKLAKDKKFPLYFVDKDADLTLMGSAYVEGRKIVKDIPALVLLTGEKAEVVPMPQNVEEIKKILGL